MPSPSFALVCRQIASKVRAYFLNAPKKIEKKVLWMRFLSGRDCKREAVFTALILVNTMKRLRNEILEGFCVKKINFSIGYLSECPSSIKSET